MDEIGVRCQHLGTLFVKPLGNAFKRMGQFGLHAWDFRSHDISPRVMVCYRICLFCLSNQVPRLAPLPLQSGDGFA